MKIGARHELLQRYPDGPHFVTSTTDMVQAWIWKVFSPISRYVVRQHIMITPAEHLVKYARLFDADVVSEHSVDSKYIELYENSISDTH